MDLSICIVNWNTRFYLEECLISIYQTVKDIDSEIIVVDNASLDDSSGMLRDSFPNVHLTENKRNIGLAAGNNQAARAARGDYILFLNPDTVMTTGAINGMLEFARQTPEAGIMSCMKVQPGKGGESVFRSYPILKVPAIDALTEALLALSDTIAPHNSIIGNLKLQHALKVFDLDGVNSNEPFEVDMVWGAVMLARKSCIEAIGLFDERFFYGVEDKDICLRMRESGKKVFFDPRFEVLHHKGKGVSQWNVNRSESIKVYSRMLLYRKHLGRLGLLKNASLELIVVSGKGLLQTLMKIASRLRGGRPEPYSSICIWREVSAMTVNIFRVFLGIGHPVHRSTDFPI